VSRKINLSQADTEELREFIEELAVMARTGQSLSIISGFHMAWWGGVVTLGCLLCLVKILYGFPVGDGHIWAVAMMIGWIGNSFLTIKFKQSKRAGALAYANRVTRYVWFGIGLVSTLVILFEATELANFAERGYFIVFLLCGIGLVTTSAAGNEPLLLLSGIGWFVFGFASLLFAPNETIAYGATVIACVVLLVLPGLIIGIRSK